VNRAGITVKIWLSVGVFALGFVLSIVLGQLQGVQTEGTLRDISEGLFPAAQRSQGAESGFQRMVKGFSDAVMTQDSSGVDKAGAEGAEVVKELQALAGVHGAPQQLTAEAARLAGEIERMVNEARGLYGSVLANPANMNAETQDRMRALAGRTDTIKAALAAFKTQCSEALQSSLAAVQRSSSRQRMIALAVFCGTILLAGLIVHLTIRRSITGPIRKVIDGVTKAADESAETSNRIAESGRMVTQNAQDQAASIEETSASLEQISAVTRQNAGRAAEADGVMRKARGRADHAASTMNDLTKSMHAITKSSNQVAAVLKSIDEIAFHTNILALNAAVEAARAGAAGAGFSVVADEVRSLAQRAADAARNSSEIVEQTIQDVKQGGALVDAVQQAFEEVSTAIATGSEVVSHIARSSEEQARGVTQIGQAMSRIEAVTQSNSSNAHETAEAAAQMSFQVETTRRHLEELVQVVGLEK
jgi:methyl-accepting chemotaxis protein